MDGGHSGSNRPSVKVKGASGEKGTAPVCVQIDRIYLMISRGNQQYPAAQLCEVELTALLLFSRNTGAKRALPRYSHS